MPATASEAATALHRELAVSILDLLRREGAQPGDPLRQDDLAERLGVSRTPVRGALALLERQGCVVEKGRQLVVPDAGLPPPERIAVEPPSDDLVVRIAHERVGGRLPDVVSEADLQRRFGVPRGEMLHALRRLGELGIASRRRGHGWTFTPGLASPEDRAAAYRFRAVVEPAALREPGYTVNSSFVTDMIAQHRAVLDRPWRSSDAVAFFEMNAAFHLGIVAGSGNRFFVQAAEQQVQLRRLLNYDWQLGPERVRVSTLDHLAILEALASGDRAGAADRLAAHLTSTAALPTQLPRGGSAAP